MPGNKFGAAKTVKTILKKDPDHFRRIGAIGGKLSKNGGFASQKTSPDGRTGQDRARAGGAAGGKRSKRGFKFIKHESGYNYYTSNTTGDVVKFKGE